MNDRTREAITEARELLHEEELMHDLATMEQFHERRLGLIEMIARCEEMIEIIDRQQAEIEVHVRKSTTIGKDLTRMMVGLERRIEDAKLQGEKA